MKIIKEDVNKIDAYWRAANYLTVAFMFLKSNIFLKRDISVEDVKQFASGHWGTAPGVNFIVAHLNYFIKNYRRRVQLTIGPGHAGNALFANLLLEGTLHKYYDLKDEKLNLDIDKVQDCISKVRTENNPFFPGTVYDGGELGYSLPVAFGTIMGDENLLHVCVIGDGEFETGTIASTWRTQIYFDGPEGKVLPIIHMNGYRMSDRSMLSWYSDEQIIQYFESMNYEARIVGLNHEEMIDALNWAESIFQSGTVDKPRWPVIVLKNAKGYSAPDTESVRIQGRSDSHKNPLSKMSAEERAIYLQQWLKSYVPEELFEDNGEPKQCVKDILPEEEYKIGNSLSYYERRPLAFPKIEEYEIKQREKNDKYSNILGISKFLKDLIKLNRERFIIVSPDELKSNFLGELKEYCDEINAKCVWEVLNENICQAWMQGYIASGRNALMIGYEAFMPVIISMVNQYAKWIYQSNKIEWRKKRASHTYLLTSVWEANTFSHQNPAFIDYLVTMQYDFVRVYLPIDANSTLVCLKECLESENQINAIESTKQSMQQYLSLEEAQKAINDGVVVQDYIRDDSGNIDLLLVSAGDYCARECKEAIHILSLHIPNINVRHIAVIELTVLGSPNNYPHAMDEEAFNKIFTKNSPMVFCYHGYESSIKALLFDRLGERKVSVLGYCNRSIHSVGDVEKMSVNGNSRYGILMKGCEYLKESNKEFDVGEVENLAKKYSG